jgi:malate synthase
MNQYQLRVKELNDLYLSALGKVSDYNQFNSEVRKEKRNQDNLKIRDQFLASAESVQKEFEKKRTELITKRNKIKFPLFNSLVSAEKQIGSSEIQTATIFISSPKTENQIIEAIKEARLNSRYDFVSTILDHLLSSSIESRKSQSLIDEVAQLSKQIYNELGLPEVLTEIREVESGILALKSFVKLLGSDFAFEPVKTFRDWQSRYQQLT